MVWLLINDGNYTGLQLNWAAEHFIALENGCLSAYKIGDNALGSIQLTADTSIDEDVFIPNIEGLAFRIVYPSNNNTSLALALSSAPGSSVSIRSIVIVPDSADNKERWIKNLVDVIQSQPQNRSSSPSTTATNTVSNTNNMARSIAKTGSKKSSNLIFEGVVTLSSPYSKKPSSSNSLSIAEYRLLRRKSGSSGSQTRPVHYYVNNNIGVESCSSERIDFITAIHEGWENVGPITGSSWNKRFLRLYSDGSLEFSTATCICSLSLNNALVTLDESSKSSHNEKIYAFSVLSDKIGSSFISSVDEIESLMNFTNFVVGRGDSVSTNVNSTSSSSYSFPWRGLKSKKTKERELLITLGAKDIDKRDDCAREILEYARWYWTCKHKIDTLKRLVITKGWMWIKGPFNDSPWIERYAVLTTSMELYIYSDMSGTEIVRKIYLGHLAENMMRLVTESVPVEYPQRQFIEIESIDRLWKMTPRASNYQSLALDIGHWLEQLKRKDEHFREYHKNDIPEYFEAMDEDSHADIVRDMTGDDNEHDYMSVTHEEFISDISEEPSEPKTPPLNRSGNNNKVAVRKAGNGLRNFDSGHSEKSNQSSDKHQLSTQYENIETLDDEDDDDDEEDEDEEENGSMVEVYKNHKENDDGDGASASSVIEYGSDSGLNNNDDNIKDEDFKDSNDSLVEITSIHDTYTYQRPKSGSFDDAEDLENDKLHSSSLCSEPVSDLSKPHRIPPPIPSGSATKDLFRANSAPNAESFPKYKESHHLTNNFGVTHHYRNSPKGKRPDTADILEERTIWQRISGNVPISSLSRSRYSTELILSSLSSSASSSSTHSSGSGIKNNSKQAEYVTGVAHDDGNGDPYDMGMIRKSTHPGRSKLGTVVTTSSNGYQQTSVDQVRSPASASDSEHQRSEMGRFPFRGSALLRLASKESKSSSPRVKDRRRFSIGVSSPSSLLANIRGGFGSKEHNGNSGLRNKGDHLAQVNEEGNVDDEEIAGGTYQHHSSPMLSPSDNFVLSSLSSSVNEAENGNMQSMVHSSSNTSYAISEAEQRRLLEKLKDKEMKINKRRNLENGEGDRNGDVNDGQNMGLASSTITTSASVSKNTKLRRRASSGAHT